MIKITNIRHMKINRYLVSQDLALPNNLSLKYTQIVISGKEKQINYMILIVKIIRMKMIMLEIA
jgi:hypothetical protein